MKTYRDFYGKKAAFAFPKDPEEKRFLKRLRKRKIEEDRAKKSVLVEEESKWEFFNFALMKRLAPASLPKKPTKVGQNI